MVCSKPFDLKNMTKALEDESRMAYWDEIDHEIDEICLKIAECPKKCGNRACYNLQHSEEIELAFAEEMADNSIYDSLPDDEFF